jgi:O-antigen/teichoic acid export membrane protein
VNDPSASSEPSSPAGRSLLNRAELKPEGLLVDIPPSSTSPPRQSRVRGASTVFTDLASVSGARLASAVLSVLTVIMTTRILDPAGFALIAEVAIISSLMFTTTSAWTATAVARYGREELELEGTMRSTSSNRLLVTAPLVVLSTAVVLILSLAGALPAEMTWTFVGLAIISGLLLIASEHIITLLEAAGRMRLTATVLTLRQCFSTAILVAIFVSGHGRSPLVIVVLGVVALAIVVVLMATRVWSVALWPPTMDRVLMRRMLAFSIPLVAFSASQYIIQSVDIVILRVYGTQGQAGIYAVAYQGYGVLQAVATTSTIVLTPLFVSLAAARKQELIGRYVSRAIPQLLFLSAVAAALVVPFLGVVVPIVVGVPFRDAVEPLAVLFTALVFYVCASFSAPILVLNERTRMVAAISLAAAGINVVGDILFVGPLHLGLLGPALATALALGVIAVGYLIVAERCTQTRASRGAVLLLAPLIMATFPVLLLGPWVALALGVSAAILATAAILRWASPFASGDLDMIAKLDIPPSAKGLILRGLHRVAR